MKLGIVFLMFITSFSSFGAQSFQITLEKTSTIVNAPSRSEWSKSGKVGNSKTPAISVTFVNKTTSQYHAVIKTQHNVLKRFVIKPMAQKTLEMEYKDSFNYSFVPMSPPGQTIQLAFSGTRYEIPSPKQ